MKRLILKSFQSPGDVVMLTAAVRDLHAACPGQFLTDVRTSAPELWENNPHLTPLGENEPGVETLDMHYPLIHQSNQRPYHFLHGYPQYLEEKLGVRIPLTRFHGDLHLSAAERAAPPPGRAQGAPERFWLVTAGGKYDFTAKWWNPASFQAVVDRFRGRLTFVQVGEAGHWHPPLDGVVNLVGQTTLRELIRLVYHAEGVLCPVTLAMHLAAAIPAKPGAAGLRPCVVVAGGREPAHWEQYPGHQFLSTVGLLPCCAHGGCWRSRCQTVGDGDEKDRRHLCERPVQVSESLRIPQCMERISPEEVIRRIEQYSAGLQDGAGLLDAAAPQAKPSSAVLAAEERAGAPAHPAPPPEKSRDVLVEFRHGLGDAVQLTIVLKHLQRLRPEWNVDAAALRGKHSALRGLCRRVYVLDRDRLDRSAYRQVFSLDWHEAQGGFAAAPSTKPTRCLQEVFGIEAQAELCRYEIQRAQRADEAARAYLAEITRQPPRADGRYPAFLLHYEGNTSGDRKNLPHELAAELCQEARRLGLTPVILDWDRRSPLPDGRRVFCPGADHPLWGGAGTGDAETLAALMEAASLVSGVDSGPLHVAGAVSTPTLGIWTRHHPAHYFDLAEHVLHLVPQNYERLARAPQTQAFFEQRYRRHVYRDLGTELPAAMASLVAGEPLEAALRERRPAALTSAAYDRCYYEEHKQAGLDYLGFGPWQQEYGRWWVESLGLAGKQVLDVGCACGSVLRGLGQAGAIVRGVDVNEHMIRLGRAQWPDMAPLLAICDAANLHLYANETFDAIHTAQVAEHWPPLLVPAILQELWRVTRPGGLLWLCLDTQEMYDRQHRRPETEDPTHLCIEPLSWWRERLAEAGWEDGSAPLAEPLRSHPLSYLRRYDWDWLVARKPVASLAERPASLAATTT